MPEQNEQRPDSDVPDPDFVAKRQAAKQKMIEEARIVLKRRLDEEANREEPGTVPGPEEKDLWGAISEVAFPERTKEEVAPIGLVYAGVRWGRDFRFQDVPWDEAGKPITGCLSGTPEYQDYLAWLSDYLRRIEEETPIEEQEGLCRYVQNMRPEDAMSLVGMNGAIYDFETEGTWICIESGEDIEDTLAQIDPEGYPEDDPYDESTERERYLKVKREFEQWKSGSQGGGHADIGYRLPLAKTLSPVREKKRRIKLLEAFYSVWFHYAAK